MFFLECIEIFLWELIDEQCKLINPDSLTVQFLKWRPVSEGRVAGDGSL